MYGVLLRFIRNWRTTAMGVGSIFTGLGDIFSQLGAGHFNSENFGPDLAAIMVGVGLLFARDSVVSEQEHHEDRKEIKELKEAVRGN